MFLIDELMDKTLHYLLYSYYMIDICKFWKYPTNCSVEYPSTPCFHRDLNYPLHGESRLLMDTVNNNDNNNIPFKQSSP